MSSFALGQYLGRIDTSWRTDSIVLAQVVHPRPRTNGMHGHQGAFVSLVLEGDYAESAGRRTFRYERFDALYHPAEIEHDDQVGGRGVRLLMLEFRLGLCDGLRLDRPSVRALRDLSGSRPAWEMLAMYRRAMSGDVGLDLEASALELIAGMAGVPSRVPRDRQALSRARDYLHAHFHDRVMMKDVAGAACIHPVYLGQLFRREAGETIGRYLNRLRVRAAAERLCTTDHPLAEVALDHGFCDQSHFQRVFRQLTGVTPATFRSRFGFLD